uniref:Uncharacterized protein n=1 Tax=Glossina palpalis gambiensis TaxID=67801 RepID=A0A1B0BK04_9MUSC
MIRRIRRIVTSLLLPLNAVEEEVYTIESSYRTFACAKNALLWTKKDNDNDNDDDDDDDDLYICSACI